MDLRLPLTNPQRRALRKLKSDWQTRSQIDELRATLNALVDRGLANRAFSNAEDTLCSENIWRITPLGTEELARFDAKKKKPKWFLARRSPLDYGRGAGVIIQRVSDTP